MEWLLILVFCIGYLGIAFEHFLRIDKAASALITGVLCWVIYMFSGTDAHHGNEVLMHHMGDIASILFFLLGAMTIVELIDAHDGFEIITSRIKTTRKSRLLWIVALITFFLSAVLDNLTTAIVMISMMTKLLSDRDDRLWFAGVIVIASNAGGAWSPLGDVTTTMLWIKGQISADQVILKLFIPSLLVMILPTALLAFRFRKKTFNRPEIKSDSQVYPMERNIVFFSGLLLFLCVPVFKIVTHLPPFMGMMLSVGLMWIVTSFLHARKDADEKRALSVHRALERIDTPSILFFLGILLAVAALEASGSLVHWAQMLDQAAGNKYIVGGILGMISAIVDNVPLVAAAQGMYSLETYPPDDNFWHFLALSTGTGGSTIIIGTAAGVAAMGLTDFPFFLYLKRISWLALLGFLAGSGLFILLN